MANCWRSWPYFSGDDGPLSGRNSDKVNVDFSDDFDTKELPLRYTLEIRIWKIMFESLMKKRMVLKGSSVTLDEDRTWIGIRQKDFCTQTTAVVSLKIRCRVQEPESAHITVTLIITRFI